MAPMQTLGDLIDQRPAIYAGKTCQEALGAFVHDLECRCLAVVEGDRPVGVVHRDAFMARMEAPGASDRALRDAAEPDPLLADAAEPVSVFVERALKHRPAALLAGFIVTKDGAYAGVCDLAMLMPGLSAAPPAGAALIERVCAEVRDPVANMRSAAEGLLRLRLPDAAAAHVATIGEASEAALSLLDVAADLQRAEAGRLDINPAPHRLQELMDRIEASWRDEAQVAGVTLLVSYDGAPDTAAMIDSARLEQVFDALIGHAMAQSRRGVIEASLQVRAGDAGMALVGKVRDNGVAYSPARLAAMFGAAGQALEEGGVGLQLALGLAQHAIVAMGGTMVAKPNPGPGATVSFELAVLAAADSDAEDEMPLAGGGRRAAHILVVDDNATNRMVVEALCEMFNCSTESVVDGVEAVEAAKAGRFDVILMDIKMPRMDGVTAAREIRKLPGHAGQAPIIALTANADADEVAQYLAAGMRSVVEKPIKPEKLMEALDAALAERVAPPQSNAAAA
jgi:two-component system, sensor histidine kinase